MHLNLAGIISADTENVCVGAPEEVFGQKTTARTGRRLKKKISGSNPLCGEKCFEKMGCFLLGSWRLALEEFYVK